MGRNYLWAMLSASQGLQRIRDWQCTLPTQPGVSEPCGADGLVSHANCTHVFLIQGLSVVTFWMHLPRLCRGLLASLFYKTPDTFARSWPNLESGKRR